MNLHSLLLDRAKVTSVKSTTTTKRIHKDDNNKSRGINEYTTIFCINVTNIGSGTHTQTHTQTQNTSALERSFAQTIANEWVKQGDTATSCHCANGEYYRKGEKRKGSQSHKDVVQFENLFYVRHHQYTTTAFTRNTKKLTFHARERHFTSIQQFNANKSERSNKTGK